MRAATLGLWACLAIATTTISVSGQERAESAARWPAPWNPPPVSAVTDAEPIGTPRFAVAARQERPLPVYDDAGDPILYEEIAARVDPSGNKGAFWGALLGFSLGGMLGAALGPHDCDRVEGGYRYYCSPREDALNGVMPFGFALVGATWLGWAGWASDKTTWDEALAQIRAERRRGIR